MQRGSTNIDGITITWALSRTATRSPDDGDYDVQTHDRITVTANGASLRATRMALDAAALLQRARALEAYLTCPTSDARLEPIGLDSHGNLLLQVWRGERQCDAMTVNELAHLNPQMYAEGEARTAVAWMQDVAVALRDSSDRSERQLRDALCEASHLATIRSKQQQQ